MTNETSFLRLYGPIELVSSTTSCWNCKKETPVHALAVRDLEDHDGESEPVRIEEPAFVYDLAEDAMPEPLVKALQELAPNYVPTYSGTLGETTWANTCVHCQALQGAFYMHSEPDGPFFGGPTREPASTRHQLHADGFDVDEGGYSF